MRLCGISSRFQLLSPCMRQVTHALLTRPPLSHKLLQSEEIRSKCFVRLACIKHAASVHPEPGSNSRQNLSPVSRLRSSVWIKTLSFLYPFTVRICSDALRFFLKFREISGMVYTVQLPMCGCCLFSRQLVYITTRGPQCQQLFYLFFKLIYLPRNPLDGL